MLADTHCHHESIRAAVTSVRHIRQPGHRDVAESHDFDRQMFSVPVTRIQLSIIVLLSLVLPFAICDSSLCSSEYWCISTSSADPCSLYSLHTGAAVGQLCRCSDYQHNFIVCLNNVSAA